MSLDSLKEYRWMKMNPPSQRAALIIHNFQALGISGWVHRSFRATWRLCHTSSTNVRAPNPHENGISNPNPNNNISPIALTLPTTGICTSDDLVTQGWHHSRPLVPM